MLLMVNNEVSELDGEVYGLPVKQVPCPLLTLRGKVYFLNDSD